MARERVAELAIRKGMSAEHWQIIESAVAA